MKKNKLLSLATVVLAFSLAACNSPSPSSSSSSSSSESSSSSSSSAPKDAAVDEKGFVYELAEDGKSYSVYYDGDRAVNELTVPASYDGIKVTTLLHGSFAGMEELETVILPASLTEIEDNVFVGNLSLKSVRQGLSELSIVISNGINYVLNSELVIGENNFEGSLLPYINFGGYNADGDIEVNYDLGSLADKVVMDIKMNEVSPVAVEETVELKGQGHFVLDTTAHGLYQNNKITLQKGEDKVLDLAPVIPVYAYEYNIALLTATYPNTIFSLSAPTITRNGAVPTYVLLERYAAYNWDTLQWNIRALPNIARADATAANNTKFFGNAGDWMKEYIAELYIANPEAKFHFYFTDLSIDYFYYTVVAQDIPEESYDLVMLSDGSGSAAILNNVYATYSQGKPYAKHAQMMDSIKKVDAYIRANGWDPEYIANNLLDFNGNKQTFEKPAFYFANHAYSTLCLYSDNCEYWLNRLRAGENLKPINDIDPNFVTTILGTKGLKQNIYANSLLAKLSAEDQVKFKALFHFDSSDFDASRETGQKIMVILGTSWSGEGDLYGLVKATMDYYGDEYDYYYKPHPGWPTSTCPERAVVLKQLNDDGYKVIEMDGAIAAEIIMYFNNDIYLCGYDSTTYASLDESNNGMGACDWTTNTTLYPDYMFSYMSKVAADSPLYTQYSLDAAKTYYVVYINSNETNPKIKELHDLYDTAFICSEDGVVSYFKDGAPVVLGA